MANIFIVEDDLVLCEIYKDIFDLTKHKIIGIAHNGLLAIKMFKEFIIKPDLVIMDYRMPEMNGRETAIKIRELKPEIKIIFASADESVRESCFFEGVYAFKVKPFSITRLLKNVENALGCLEISIY